MRTIAIVDKALNDIREAGYEIVDQSRIIMMAARRSRFTSTATFKEDLKVAVQQGWIVRK